MLPSQVLQHATTQDVYVFDMSNTYEAHQKRKAQAKSGVHSDEPQALTPDLLERYERFQHENKSKSK